MEAQAQAQAKQIAQQRTLLVRKGPIEGMILVNGCPERERCDMPAISFESILALQRISEKRQ